MDSRPRQKEWPNICKNRWPPPPVLIVALSPIESVVRLGVWVCHPPEVAHPARHGSGSPHNE